MRSMRLRPILVVLALLHFYIAARLLLPLGLAAQVAGAAVLIASFALMPRGFGAREDRGPREVLIRWIAAGFFSWLLVLTLARDASLVIARFAVSPEALDAWTRASPLGVMGLPAA